MTDRGGRRERAIEVNAFDHRIDAQDLETIALRFDDRGIVTDANLHPIGRRRQPAADARELHPDGIEPVYPVQQMEAWGYAPLAHVDADLASTLLTLEGEHGPEYWLTFRNFYVITRYNKSPLYSMAVWEVAQAIADGVAEPPAP